MHEREKVCTGNKDAALLLLIAPNRPAAMNDTRAESLCSGFSFQRLRHGSAPLDGCCAISAQLPLHWVIPGRSNRRDFSFRHSAVSRPRMV